MPHPYGDIGAVPAAGHAEGAVADESTVGDSHRGIVPGSCREGLPQLLLQCRVCCCPFHRHSDRTQEQAARQGLWITTTK